jgi:hypothetical protein
MIQNSKFRIQNSKLLSPCGGARRVPLVFVAVSAHAKRGLKQWLYSLLKREALQVCLSH